MSTRNGCNFRLRKPVGSSGYCDPCWPVVRIERLVFTRCPPHTAGDLVEYIQTVTTTLERTCEKFEADRTAGFVTDHGEPIPGAREKVLASRAGGDSFERVIHRGEKDQRASSTRKASSDTVPVKKEREADSGKEPLVDAQEQKQTRRNRSRRRRRSKSNTKRSRSRHRSKRKERKDKSGTPDPETSGIEETQEEKPSPSARVEEHEEQPEEELALVHTEEEEQDDAETGNRLELRRTAKPSARKPLPRRPRSPSYSPPGYRDREDQKPKKWKGLKRVIRGQLYYSGGASRAEQRGKAKGKVRDGTESDAKASSCAPAFGRGEKTSSTGRGGPGTGPCPQRGAGGWKADPWAGGDLFRDSLPILWQGHGGVEGPVGEILHGEAFRNRFGSPPRHYGLHQSSPDCGRDAEGPGGNHRGIHTL